MATSLLAGCGQKNETKTTTVVTNSSITTMTTTTNSTKTFAINQDYPTPENGVETLKGNLVVQDGIIKNVNIEKNGHKRESKENISNFSNSIAGEIVGKPLKNLQIGKVGGASLSSAAFNEALKGINS